MFNTRYAALERVKRGLWHAASTQRVLPTRKKSGRGVGREIVRESQGLHDGEFVGGGNPRHVARFVIAERVVHAAGPWDRHKLQIEI